MPRSSDSRLAAVEEWKDASNRRILLLEDNLTKLSEGIVNLKHISAKVDKIDTELNQLFERDRASNGRIERLENRTANVIRILWAIGASAGAGVAWATAEAMGIVFGAIGRAVGA